MTRRGLHISWVLIVSSSVFIAGYLLRHGEGAHGRDSPGSERPPETYRAPLVQTVKPEAASSIQSVKPEAAPVVRTAKRVTRPVVQTLKPESVPGPEKPESGRTEGQRPLPVQSLKPVSPLPTSRQSEEQLPLAPASNQATAPRPEPTTRQPPRVLRSSPPVDEDAPPLEDSPRIQFSETDFDFGSMYQQDELTHEFTFTNVGKDTLKVSRVRTTCGCTAGVPSKQELAPNEKGTIKVTFRSGRYRNRVTKRIYVDTNDPVEPRAILTLTGEVKVEVDVSPSGVYLGRLKTGETVERSVDLTPVEVESFKVVEVKTNHPVLHAEHSPAVVGQKAGYVIKIRFGPCEKAARVNARVTVSTDLAHAKELVISVFGRVVEAQAANVQPPK